MPSKEMLLVLCMYQDYCNGEPTSGHWACLILYMAVLFCLNKSKVITKVLATWGKRKSSENPRKRNNK